MLGMKLYWQERCKVKVMDPIAYVMDAYMYKPRSKSPKKWIPQLGLDLTDKKILLSSTE